MPRVATATRRTTTEVLEPLPEKQEPVEPREIAAAPEDQTFWDWMQGTTAEDWEKKVWACYIYRLEPPAGKVIGEPAFLTKFVRPFTVEEVQSEFGGGKYMYWMKERGMKHMYRGNFRIAGDPKTPGAQLAGSDAAGLQPIFQRMFDEFAKARNSGVDPTKATEQAMGILTTAYQTGLQTIGKSSEPTKLTEIIDAVSKMQNLSGSKSSSVMDGVMAKLLERLVDPPDPLEKLQPILEIAERIGGGGARGGDWRVSIAQNLPTVMAHIKDIAHEFALASQANAVAAQHTLLTQPVRPTTTPTSPPGFVPPTPATATVAAAPTGPLPLDPISGTPQPPGETMPTAPVPTDHETWIKRMIAQKILQGWDATDLHGWLLDTAPEVIEELKPHSVEELLFFFGSDPVLRLVPKSAALRKLIEDFLKVANEEEAPKPN